MARVRNLQRIDLYCPEYMTNATILIDQNHHSGQPHLVAHYEMDGLKGQMQFAAAIPAHWGDDDLVELFSCLWKNEKIVIIPRGRFQPATMGRPRFSNFGSVRRRPSKFIVRFAPALLKS
jgi:hypothetical protein